MAPRIAPPSGAFRASFAVLFLALVLTLVGQGLPATTPAANAANPPDADAPCSTTVSSPSALTSAIKNASNGSVVCVANGSYGSITVNANRSGWVTVRSVNPFGAKFSSITLSNAAYVRFEQLDISGRFGNVQDSSHHIQIAGSVVGSVWAEAPPKSKSGPGPHDWVIEYNDIPNCYSFCVALVSESPDRYWPVSDITVRGNKMGPMAGGDDAIRIHNWRNLLIEDNEIFGVIENGDHNDCLQSVWGGHGIVFRGNYLHDNNCQTFFLKDGYTTDIEVSNNLSLRNRAGSAPVVGQIWPSADVVMKNNTFWDESSFYLRNGTYSSMFTSGPATNYEVTKNVFVQFLPYDNFESDANRAGIFKNSSVLSEDRNVFGSGWSWVPNHMGPHSIQDSSPDFRRETNNRSQDLSVGDYRLAGPVTKSGSTYTPGITWKLAGRTFGVEAYGLTPPGSSGGSGDGGTPLGDWSVKRISGDDRYETAAAVSSTVFSSASVVYIASGEDFPDALSAAAAAGKSGAPVLLVDRSLTSKTRAELSRLDPSTIYVIGGTSAVPNTVVNELKAYGTVKRIAGVDRYATAAAVSESAFSSASKVFIANGENFPDAMAAAAAAGHSNAPVLLVDDRVPSVTKAELARLDPSTIYVIGGTAAVSNDVVNRLDDYGTVKRIAGNNRYATAAAVSKAFFSSASKVFVASGGSFPDALSAAAAGGHVGGPVLLVGSSVPSSTEGRAGSARTKHRLRGGRHERRFEVGVQRPEVGHELAERTLVPRPVLLSSGRV